MPFAKDKILYTLLNSKDESAQLAFLRSLTDKEVKYLCEIDKFQKIMSQCKRKTVSFLLSYAAQNYDMPSLHVILNKLIEVKKAQEHKAEEFPLDTSIIDIIDSEGYSFLHRVIQRGNNELLYKVIAFTNTKILVQEIIKANINNHWNGLHLAAAHLDSDGFCALLKIMTESEIDEASQKTSINGNNTVLHLAAEFLTEAGFCALLNLMTETAINVCLQIKNAIGEPLLQASYTQSLSSLTLLFEKASPFVLAAIHDDLDFFIRFNTKLKEKDKDQAKALLTNLKYFIETPEKAINERAQDFIDFVINHFRMKIPKHTDFLPWIALLEKAIKACPEADLKSKDQLFVLLGQANLHHYYQQDKGAGLDYLNRANEVFIAIKDPNHLNRDHNELIGAHLRIIPGLEEVAGTFLKAAQIQGSKSAQSVLKMGFYAEMKAETKQETPAPAVPTTPSNDGILSLDDETETYSPKRLGS